MDEPEVCFSPMHDHDPEVDETPVAPQSNENKCVTVLKRSMRACMMAIMYIFFVYAVILQSAYTRKPMDPVDWEKELKGTSWLFALAVFALLFACAFASVFTTGPLSDGFLYTFLGILFILHLITLDYASNRPELCSVPECTTPKQHYLCIQSRFRLYYWRNYLSLASLLLEAGQYFSVALNQRESFSDADVSWWDKILLSFQSQIASYVIVMVFVLAYGFLVGIVVELNSKPTEPISVFLFEVAAGTAYLSITTRLLSVAVAAETKTRAITCLIGLMFYASTAVFIGSYRGDQTFGKSDVHYAPRYLVLERLVRGILSVGVALSGTKHRWALNIVGITLISALIVVLLHSNCCSLKGFVRARVALLLGYVWAFMGVMLQLGGVLHSAFTFTLIGVAGIFVISLIVFLLTPYVSQWRVKLCGGSARVEPSPSLDEGMDDDDTDHHTPLKHAPSSFNDNNGMIVDGVSGARSSVGSVSIQWGDDVTRTHSNGGGVGSSERRLIQMSTIEETAVS